jgi:hypothetical protein
MTDENESIEEMVNGHSSNLNGGEMEKSAENERVSEYFAQPQVPRLEAIIYAEFDNNIGRVVKYQVFFAFLAKNLIISAVISDF